jgi:RecB family exonuclease
VASLRDCPLRWFLDRRVGAGNPSGGAAVVGLVVHAVAEAIARGDVAADEREIGPFVDEIWASVPFPAHYQRVNERRRVDEMITALLAWDASTGRSVAATELAFNVPVPGTSRPVHVSGLIDRVDRSADGRLHVVDFKTGRTAATAAATAEHPQLGIYQLAIRQGALDVAGAPGESPTRAEATVTPGVGLIDPPAGPGASWTAAGADPTSTLASPDGTEASAGLAPPAGSVVLGQAELVHLADRYASGMPKVRIQAPLEAGWTWVNDLIVDAARLADGPEYPARPNGQCKSCAFRFMCPAQMPDPARAPGSVQHAVASGAAESPGALTTAPLTSNGSLASSDAAPAQADQPRTSTFEGPVQQALWGDDL